MKSELQKAVATLAGVETGWKQFAQAPAKGAKPGGVSTGYPASSKAGAGGGFDESEFDQREYWPAVTLTSSDGIITFQIEPIKVIKLVGGGKATFKQPT